MTGSEQTNPWVVCWESRPAARLRLFCFPNAGGGASAFRTWSSGLPAEIEVCAIQLPGREHRIREAPLSNLNVLLGQLVDVLPAELNRPFALFGHSVGAVVAFETARALQRLSLPAAVHLFVAGCNAPHLPVEGEVLHQLDDQALIDRLRQFSGTPEPLFDDPEFMQLVLPILRADLALSETHQYAPGPPLQCPITVLAGVHDPHTDRAGLDAWQQQTSAAYCLRVFPGNHFFPATNEVLVLETIARELLDA